MKRLLATTCVTVLMSVGTPALAQDDEGPSYSRNGADTCLACHSEDEVVVAVFRTRHGVPTDPRSPFGQGQLQCEACHGPGGSHAGRVRRGQERPAMPHFAPKSAATVEEDNNVCLDCHMGKVGFGWHAGAIPSDELRCIDCHDIHSASDRVRETATQAEVCFQCHKLVRAETRKAFAHPISDGKMECTGCHSIHGENALTMLARGTVNDTCQQCHAEKRGPYLWEHAPVSEDCGLCHSPHGSNHPGMLSMRGPLLCQSCHSQAGHPSVAYQDGALVAGSASQFLLGQNCLNCHSQVHGSNHPSGSRLMR